MKIIGICGPSCSGKSSVAKSLAKQLRCDVISVDFFYAFECEKTYIEHNGETIRSFERPEHYDGARVANIVKELREKGRVTIQRLPHETSKNFIEETLIEKEFLIIEGFQLLNYPELERQIDESFYIDLEFEELAKRRMQRYDRGSKDDDFVKIGKQEWEHIGLNQKEKANYVLDGMKTIPELTKEIINILQQNNITFSVEEDDNYTEEDMRMIDSIATDFFDTKNDLEQLPGDELTISVCKNTYPLSLNVIKKNSQFIGYTFASPCTHALMQEFIDKKITEREMYEQIKKENIRWENADAIYFAGAQTIKKYQQKGIGTKARIIQIKKLQEKYPNLKQLFCWTYSEMGNKTVKRIQEQLEQEILIRN